MGEKRATPQGTEKYFQKNPIHPSKQRRLDGLAISALGAGTYLGPADEETDLLYEKVLLQAGQNGINFFDTAIHYRSMRSEKVLKKVIQALAAKGISREEIVIATKGGFLPEDEDYVRTQYLDPGIIERSDIVSECHCMTPAFLENQIDSSLKNLGLACIDLYFLQNPEIELMEVGEAEFYQRLTRAFSLFEKAVQEGKIGYYGIATWNGFRVKKGALQLSKILECARLAGGEGHHLKAIQIPYNLVMLEAMKLKNQIIGKEKKTIAEMAREAKVHLIAAAPLMQGQVPHLCFRVFEKLPPEETHSLQSLQYVLSAPGWNAALTGMREIAHWEENRKVLARPDWPLKEWEAAKKSLSG